MKHSTHIPVILEYANCLSRMTGHGIDRKQNYADSRNKAEQAVSDGTLQAGRQHSLRIIVDVLIQTCVQRGIVAAKC